MQSAISLQPQLAWDGAYRPPLFGCFFSDVTPPSVVVTGVAGSGKTTLGIALARALGERFLHSYLFADGDDFLPLNLKAKLRRRIPLSHPERMHEWIPRLYCHLVRSERTNTPTVLAFSGLRRLYRDIVAVPNTIQFFLDVSPDVARERIRQRPAHLVEEWIVDSQFEALERPAPDELLVVLDATKPLHVLVANCCEIIFERPRKQALTVFSPSPARRQ